tara:strand:+ start:306 stop:767 length:462 start_codon:yes stop_codon:yes gene_type:complete
MSYKMDFKTRNNNPVGEGKAEEYYKQKGVFLERYGLDLLDSGISVGDFCKIPKVIRNTPDYIAINKGFAFVEVKAFKGRFLRLKLEDMESYNFWSGMGGLVFFFWSIDYSANTQIRYENMVKLINKNSYEIQKYEDNNKEYYLIPWGDLKPRA